MKPASKFLALGLATVAVISVVACVATLWQIQSLNRAQLLDRLRNTSVIAEQVQASRLRELQLHTHALARDPAFVAYVTQSMMPDPELGGAIDSASISDLLSARREGYDASVVLDASGKPVTRSILISVAGIGIQQRPLVQQVITSLKPATGVWVLGDDLAWVAIDPLLRANTLQGLLLTATRVDDSFAASVSRMAQTGIAVALQQGTQSVLAASSNLGVDGADLVRMNTSQLFSSNTDSSQMGRLGSLKVGADSAPAWVTPLTVHGGKAALVAMDSSSSPQGTIPAGAIPLLLGIGVLALIAALVVMLQWSRTYLPLQRLGDILRRSARGEQFLTARNTGSGMVEHLRHAANELLTRLQK